MEEGGLRTISEISSLLATQVETVCQILLPGGAQKGGLWLSGSVDGGEGKSLQVHLDGQHQGKWRDWAESDLKGDLIDLWMQVKGQTSKQALVEIREFLGIPQPALSLKDKTFSKAKTSHAQLTPQGKIYQWFASERKIDGPTVGKFDIRVQVFGPPDAQEAFIVFPCFSPSGEWINSSYRGLVLDEKGKKKIRQDTGCAPCLFGWHSLTQEDYAGRSVVLCEGHIDAMTWNQWGIPALSIPNGSGTTWIDYEWDNLEVFETIYLSFDMDGKTAAAMHKAISRLGHHRCLIVKLPNKDANDCLKEGHTAEEAKEWLKLAKRPTIPDFVSLSDMEERLMAEFFPRPTDAVPVKVPLFTALNPENSFLIRPGELTVWTGISSHGKTTFLTYLFVEMAYKGEKSFICSLEMKPEKIAKKMALSLFRENPVTPKDIKDFIETLGEKTCFCDRIGYMKQEDLMNQMEFAHRRFGVTQFLVDSLMRIDGLEEDYPAQGKFLNVLCEFAKKFMVHVHLVAHPRKTQDDAKPTANDIKGSSLMRNNADNILVVSRNTAKEKKLRDGEITQEQADLEYDTQILVDKDREEGRMKSFKYKFLWKHHYFVPMQPRNGHK